MNKSYILCHMMTSVDGRIDCAMTEHLPPGLHKGHILQSRQPPKAAVADPQLVDHNAVIDVHNLQKQQCLPIGRPKGA